MLIFRAESIEDADKSVVEILWEKSQTQSILDTSVSMRVCEHFYQFLYCPSLARAAPHKRDVLPVHMYTRQTLDVGRPVREFP